MKRILLLIAVLFITTNNIQAGENDYHLITYSGVGYSPFQKVGMSSLFIGFEKEGIYRKFYELSLRVDSRLSAVDNTNQYDYTIGGYIKPSLYAGKNDYTLLRLGTHIGAGQKGIQGGLALGLEYNYTFPSRVKLCIMNDNILSFHSRDILMNTVLLGIKIPLN